MNKVLFVAVHPDDETLGCGGTILKHKAKGDQIYWLIVTSIKNYPTNRFTEEQIHKREETIDFVAKRYMFDNVIELGFPTILLNNIDFSELVSAIDNAIESVKPDIIYCNFKEDVHSDHRITFQALYSCTKSFRKPYLKAVYMYEALSETEFAPSLSSSSFIPNVFVDISSFIEMKLEIMTLYDTEVMPDPLPRSINTIQALAKIRGSRCGASYAEGFMLLYEKQ